MGLATSATCECEIQQTGDYIMLFCSTLYIPAGERQNLDGNIIYQVIGICPPIEDKRTTQMTKQLVAYNKQQIELTLEDLPICS